MRRGRAERPDRRVQCPGAAPPAPPIPTPPGYDLSLVGVKPGAGAANGYGNGSNGLDELHAKSDCGGEAGARPAWAATARSDHSSIRSVESVPESVDRSRFHGPRDGGGAGPKSFGASAVRPSGGRASTPVSMRRK